MIGIFFFILAAIWLIVVLWIAILVARMMRATKWRVLVGVLSFLVLLPLPLIDELVGGKQFANLCRENARVEVDREKAIGKTVYLADLPSVNVTGTWVRVTLTPWRYIDVKSGETVVSYNTLIAGRRFLLTGLGTLTFDGHCAPKNRPASVASFREFGINYIERPIGKAEK